MSMTFWMEQAPVERIQPYLEEEPDYYEVRAAYPFFEINMANGNAAAMLRVLAPEYDQEGGVWHMADLAILRSRLIRIANTDKHAELITTDDWVAPNMLISGRDEDYVRRRLTDFLNLLALAMRYEFPINYG